MTYIYQNGMAVAVEEPEPVLPIPFLIESIDVYLEPSSFGVMLTIKGRVMPWDEAALAKGMSHAGTAASVLFFKDKDR